MKTKRSIIYSGGVVKGIFAGASVRFRYRRSITRRPGREVCIALSISICRACLNTVVYTLTWYISLRVPLHPVYEPVETWLRVLKLYPFSKSGPINIIRLYIYYRPLSDGARNICFLYSILAATLDIQDASNPNRGDVVL